MQTECYLLLVGLFVMMIFDVESFDDVNNYNIKIDTITLVAKDVGQHSSRRHHSVQVLRGQIQRT